MDLSQLSDEDLLALKQGDVSKVSDQGLKYLKDQSRASESWSDLPKNVLPDLANWYKKTGQSMLQTVMHPVDTAGGISALLEGEGQKLQKQLLSKTNLLAALPPMAPAILTRKVAEKTAEAVNPSYAGNYPETAKAVADATNQAYYDKYGTLGNVKHSLITHPVETAADASTVLGLTGGLASAANMPNVAGPLLTASKFTNPLYLPVGAAKLGGKAYNEIVGGLTHQGPENISLAAQSGRAGIKAEPDFINNLLGNKSDVVGTAKQGLENMRAERAAEYRANIANVKGDKTILDLKPIDEALQNAQQNVTSFKGTPINPAAAAVVEDMKKTVDWWRAKPPEEFLTPEGLDALKQRLWATIEPLPYDSKARAVGMQVYHAVKDQIVKQAPTYAKTMEDYQQASDLISEIERTFSMSDKALARGARDTAIRKLLSLTRNNANTNYGERLSLAKALENQGGVNILPALAGQSMDKWAPRGLAGDVGAMGTVLTAAGTGHPEIALGLIPQSPKAMGLLTYGLNYPLGVAGRAATKLGLSTDPLLRTGLLLGQNPLYDYQQ